MSNIFINMIGKSGQDFLNCYHAIYHWEVGQQRREGALHDVFKAYAPEFEDKKSTVVVIDEIQESSVVYSCIREFTREFTCDFIVTGSYLGKTREKDFFLSDGDTDNLVLGTLTFPEFCIDCNYLDIVENCRYYYMDLGIAAYFLRKTGEKQSTIQGILCENYVYLEILKRIRDTDSIAGNAPWFAVYKKTGGELDFYVRSLLDYKNYGIEVKAGENSGITASDLLIDGKLDFLYYLKGIFSII